MWNEIKVMLEEIFQYNRNRIRDPKNSRKIT